jgi:hypothetical protein
MQSVILQDNNNSHKNSSFKACFFILKLVYGWKQPETIMFKSWTINMLKIDKKNAMVEEQYLREIF